MKDYKEAYQFFDFDNAFELINGKLELRDEEQSSAVADAMQLLEETKFEQAVENLDQGAVEHLLENYNLPTDALTKFAEMDYLIKLLASNPADRSPLMMLLLSDLSPSNKKEFPVTKVLLQHFISKYSFVVKQLQTIESRMN